MSAGEPLTTQIRVLVAAREPLFRDGLARSVRRDPSLQLVAELDGEAAALDAIRRLVPDVAVLDADPGGVRIVEAVAQHALATRIALLSAVVRREEAVKAIAAGTRGYLSKRIKADSVCEAIRRVADGHVVLCEEAQTAVAGEIRAGHRLLPPRELEVLTLVQRGLTNREIGRELHIAPTTVKSHIARTCERLGVHDRIGAVVEAMRRGLLR